MHVYGNIATPAAVGILILFALYLGLYHAFFGYLVGILRSSYGREAALWLSSVVWVGVELARARLTGFPWDLLGYTQVDNLTLTRMAPWTGVMGLSLVVALVNALWLTRIPVQHQHSAQLSMARATVLCLAVTVLSLRYAAPAQPVTAWAVLLQDNLKVGAEAAGVRESQEALLGSFADLSLQPLEQGGKADIVVWPEAPADFFDADPEFRRALGAVARRTNAPVVVDSISLAAERGKVLNTASFFSPDGAHSGEYYKMHLVPFGEYTPYKQLFFFAGHLLDQVGPFIPGTTRELFKTGGHRYGIFICYESIFGDEMREFAGAGADVLVNVSDDGWYGDSSAPWEHLDMVRMRAIENHRWVLRSTNTGITGSIDPYGRLVAQMPRHVRGSVLAPFGYQTDVTFYTRHGDWLGWLCAGITAGAAAAGLWRRRQVHWNAC